MHRCTMLIQKTLVIVVLTVMTTFAHGVSQPRSLWDVLDRYGFTQHSQKQALLNLMQDAGIKDADQLLKQTTDDQELLLANIIKFVSITQENFTIRTGVQEVWDIQARDWMKSAAKQKQVLADLQTLGLLDTVVPTMQWRDAICILGARKSSMDKRANFANEVLPAQELILLAGERYVTVDKDGGYIDGTEQELRKLAVSLDKGLPELTETDLIKESYRNSPIYNVLPVTVIDTPRRDLPRPTTETTMIELTDWLKGHPDIKSISFVSNQPYIEYQRAVIAEVLKQQNYSIQFEVVGPKYVVSKASSTADAIKQAVSALGAQIYASTPHVVAELGLHTDNLALQKQFTDIYSKQPLIFHQSAKAALNVPVGSGNAR